MQRLKDRAYDAFGQVAVRMKDAGVSAGGSPFDDYEGWQRVLSVNLWGVINGVHAFTQAMIDQGAPAAIVNTGSKQGITCPPGNTAYNVTKAGVKVLTEGSAHALRNIEGCQVTAHLLVPGSTFTGITARGRTGVDVTMLGYGAWSCAARRAAATSVRTRRKPSSTRCSTPASTTSTPRSTMD